jgi:hypothetical protein
VEGKKVVEKEGKEGEEEEKEEERRKRKKMTTYSYQRGVQQ